MVTINSREDFSGSSATTSNLPGPSRVVGKLFSYLGTKLERRINLLADKLGYGPLAYHRKLFKEGKRRIGKRRVPSLMQAEQRKNTVEKLMKYISYGTSLTQAQALGVVCDLILQSNVFRDEFIDAGLRSKLNELWRYCYLAHKQYQYLVRRDPDIDFLLTSSRKALVYIEENEVNTVAKPFLVWRLLDKPCPDKSAFISALIGACTTLSRYIGDEEDTRKPISELAGEYCLLISSLSYYIRPLFLANIRPRSQASLTSLSKDEIELSIRAASVPLLAVGFHSCHTNEPFMRYHYFKSHTAEGKLRIYSVVQIAFFTSAFCPTQDSDDWVNLPPPIFPEKYSKVKMELVSTTTVLVGFSKLKKLRFSLPAGLDNATLHDYTFNCKDLGKIWVDDLFMVWDIPSDA